MTTRNFVEKIESTSKSYPLRIFNQAGKAYTCVNPYYYHVVKENKDLYKSLDGLFVDGMIMCMLIRLLWGKKIQRLSFDMSGIAVELFDRLNQPSNNESIYFIGAKQDEILQAMSQMKEAYPNMNIIGNRNGYFSNEEERKQSIREIIKLNPTFVVVGMGAPLQEKYVVDLKKDGYKGISFTCGGFLHQTTQRMQYYPDWVNKYNLRAFYRLAHEKGMLSRLWHVLVTFPIQFTIDTYFKH